MSESESKGHEGENFKVPDETLSITERLEKERKEKEEYLKEHNNEGVNIAAKEPLKTTEVFQRAMKKLEADGSPLVGVLQELSQDEWQRFDTVLSIAGYEWTSLAYADDQEKLMSLITELKSAKPQSQEQLIESIKKILY